MWCPCGDVGRVWDVEPILGAEQGDPSEGKAWEGGSPGPAALQALVASLHLGFLIGNQTRSHFQPFQDVLRDHRITTQFRLEGTQTPQSSSSISLLSNPKSSPHPELLVPGKVLWGHPSLAQPSPLRPHSHLGASSTPCSPHFPFISSFLCSEPSPPAPPGAAPGLSSNLHLARVKHHGNDVLSTSRA